MGRDSISSDDSDDSGDSGETQLLEHDDPPATPPEVYGGGTDVPPGDGADVWGWNVDRLSVPPAAGGGSGNSGNGTHVDTASLLRFADHIDSLITYVRSAHAGLEKVQVKPGTFYHANALRDKINGVNGDSGLKARYLMVTTDLVEGLGSMRDGVRTLARKYESADEASRMSADDLEHAMRNADDDFDQFMEDVGDSGSKEK
ncbi:hypothetical protein PV350_22760 [Streptomyces sp. PA03-6a]|nr:hypothetical protein [Streptomyces sp. PA03-6a]